MQRLFAVSVVGLCLTAGSSTFALPSCSQAAQQVNHRLGKQLDSNELAQILDELNRTQQRRLPEKFVTKRMAQAEGWRPGSSLWPVPTLQGKSIGGDRFGNRERRLPEGKWREADLDYQGGRRGAKRLVFSAAGERYVTVDHYQTFVEVTACR